MKPDLEELVACVALGDEKAFAGVYDAVVSSVFLGGGDQAVLMRGAVDSASGMGVTVEPVGGSQQPTTTPIALVSFPV